MAETSEMQRVDPAALLGAGAAAVITLVSSSGLWTVSESVVGAVLLFVVFLFRGERQAWRTRMRKAQVVIYCLCAVVVFAYPLQRVAMFYEPVRSRVTQPFSEHVYQPCPEFEADNVPDCFTEASADIALLAGMPVFGICFGIGRLAGIAWQWPKARRTVQPEVNQDDVGPTVMAVVVVAALILEWVRRGMRH